MNGTFDGLVAVVTGGAGGIGSATAQAFVAQGASVAVLDLNLKGVPDNVRGYAADVSDRHSVTTAMAQVASDMGGIDFLVNNAGIGAIGTVEDNSDTDWKRVLDINVIGMARASAAALPYLRMSRVPAIVNVCSVAALTGLPQRALYAASKGAVLALTYAMATDYVSEHIRVNCVSPGTVSTPWVDRNVARFSDPEAELAAMHARQPTGRMVTPEEVASSIIFLCDTANQSTTGTDLSVDGGMARLHVRSDVQKVMN